MITYCFKKRVLYPEDQLSRKTLVNGLKKGKMPLVDPTTMCCCLKIEEVDTKKLFQIHTSNKH